jgi:AcrR family transcriptional regulator
MASVDDPADAHEAAPEHAPDGQPAAAHDARKRMSADERRGSIVQAARREFARGGYHGASTARIATAAGCSEPMLYKHFAGKQALFTAVLEEVSATMEASIDDVLSRPGDPIRNWLEFLPGAMESELYAEMVGLRKLAVTLVDEPDILDTLQGGTRRLVERVHMAVARGRELGTVRHDIDADYVAWMWLGITLAASFRNSIEGRGGFAAMLPHAERFIGDLLNTSAHPVRE